MIMEPLRYETRVLDRLTGGNPPSASIPHPDKMLGFTTGSYYYYRSRFESSGLTYIAMSRERPGVSGGPMRGDWEESPPVPFLISRPRGLTGCPRAERMGRLDGLGRTHAIVRPSSSSGVNIEYLITMESHGGGPAASLHGVWRTGASSTGGANAEWDGREHRDGF